MRILLVAEGKHEFQGALETLVRRLLPADTAISHIEKLKMSDPAIGHIAGRGPKLTRRILAAMRKATQLNCDTLILLIDEDGDAQRRRYVNEAQESQAFAIQRAVGVAIRTFDAWMLADESAMSRAIGSTIPCQPSPEEIPDPKDHFAAIHRDCACGLAIHETYAQVCQHARFEILSSRCVHGFAPFAQRVQQLKS